LRAFAPDADDAARQKAQRVDDDPTGVTFDLESRVLAQVKG
jgi:hypothetical protein